MFWSWLRTNSCEFVDVLYLVEYTSPLAECSRECVLCSRTSSQYLFHISTCVKL